MLLMHMRIQYCTIWFCLNFEMKCNWCLKYVIQILGLSCCTCLFNLLWVTGFRFMVTDRFFHDKVQAEVSLLSYFDCSRLLFFLGFLKIPESEAPLLEIQDMQMLQVLV